MNDEAAKLADITEANYKYPQAIGNGLFNVLMSSCLTVTARPFNSFAIHQFVISEHNDMLSDLCI